MKIFYFFIFTIFSLAGFAQDNYRPEKDTLFHDIELVQPGIDFFTPDGGLYERIPAFFSPYYIYFSAIIRNNGGFSEQNLIITVEVEDYYPGSTIIIKSDTVSILAAGQTDTIFIDSLLMLYDDFNEIRFSVSYDSISNDFTINQTDTIAFSFGGGMWDSYLRTETMDTIIGSQNFPEGSDGKYLIGCKYYIPEDLTYGPFFLSISINELSTYGTTIIGHVFNEEGNLLCSTNEYDITDWSSGISDLQFDCYSIEGNAFYYVVIDMYYGSGIIVVRANTNSLNEPEKYSVIGERSGDSIIWTTANVMPIIGLVFYPESVNQLCPENIKIFPNPALENIFIENAIGKAFEVCDFSGRKLFSHFCLSNKETIDVSKLSNGIYLLRNINSGVSERFVILR